MDEDEQGVTGFNPGAGVVITCDTPVGTEKYIGYVMGVDDLYLYAKVTHTWGERSAEVTTESLAVLRGILAQQPLWMLKAKVAWRARILPLWLSKEQLIEVLVDLMSAEAVEKAGPQGGFIAEALPTEMSLPHFSVRNVKNLSDVMGGSVLASLDFAPEGAYTEESDLEEGGDDGTTAEGTQGSH